MADQSILPGFRRWVGPEPYVSWTDGKGNPVKVAPPKGPAFYGQTVPVPLDKRGKELRCGPLHVLQRTDGCYIVYDDRSPFGENSRYLAGRGRPGLIEALGEMVRIARDEGLPVPDAPARQGRSNARGSGAGR